MIQTEKDPLSKEDFTINWASTIATDFISGSIWEVPNGLTLVSSSQTLTTTTVRLSGGRLGSIYQVLNLVTLNSGQIVPQRIQITMKAS